MTLKDLRDEIDGMDDDCEIYFDSNAVKFDCHMVKITNAFMQDIDESGKLVLVLDWSMTETPYCFGCDSPYSEKDMVDFLTWYESDNKTDAAEFALKAWKNARAKQQHLTNGSTVTPVSQASPKLPEQNNNGVR